MQLLAVLRETLFAAFFYFFCLRAVCFLALLGRNPIKNNSTCSTVLESLTDLLGSLAD